MVFLRCDPVGGEPKRHFQLIITDSSESFFGTATELSAVSAYNEIMSSGSDQGAVQPNRQFASTRWSVVRAAGGDDSKVARSALQELCQSYWFPLYAFVRRKVNDSDSAADLTQAFFADLLQRDNIKQVNPELGKFRSFLLASLKNFLNNQWDKQRAQKRGGGKAVLSIDFAQADDRYSLEPAHADTPERCFEKQWALELIDRTNQELRREFEKRGKVHQFDTLQPFLAGKNESSTFAIAAATLEMTEVAAKVTVHRMRQRFGELLRTEIANTVGDPAEIDSEIQHLFESLKS